MKVDAALRVHVLTGAASRGMAVNASDRFNVDRDGLQDMPPWGSLELPWSSAVRMA